MSVERQIQPIVAVNIQRMSLNGAYCSLDILFVSNNKTRTSCYSFIIVIFYVRQIKTEMKVVEEPMQN